MSLRMMRPCCRCCQGGHLLHHVQFGYRPHRGPAGRSRAVRWVRALPAVPTLVVPAHSQCQGTLASAAPVSLPLGEGDLCTASPGCLHPDTQLSPDCSASPMPTCLVCCPCRRGDQKGGVHLLRGQDAWAGGSPCLATQVLTLPRRCLGALSLWRSCPRHPTHERPPPCA